MKNLKTLREAQGFTRTQLAYKLGVTETSVANWERGKASPHLDQVVTLAALFGVTIDQLVGRESTPSRRVG